MALLHHSLWMSCLFTFPPAMYGNPGSFSPPWQVLTFLGQRLYSQGCKQQDQLTQGRKSLLESIGKPEHRLWGDQRGEAQPRTCLGSSLMRMVASRPVALGCLSGARGLGPKFFLLVPCAGPHWASIEFPRQMEGQRGPAKLSLPPGKEGIRLLGNQITSNNIRCEDKPTSSSFLQLWCIQRYFPGLFRICV